MLWIEMSLNFIISHNIRAIKSLWDWKHFLDGIVTNKKIPIVDIINIMEKSILIDEIGKFIIKSAFLFAKKVNSNRDKKIIVSVNISAVQIMKHSFVRTIKNYIRN